MSKPKARSEFLPSPTFTQWIHHVRAQAKYAPLAAWIEVDKNCWPWRARTLVSFLRHIDEVHGGDGRAIAYVGGGKSIIRKPPSAADIRTAFAAFERAMERGVQIPRRMGPAPMPPEKRRKLRSFSLAPETPPGIAKLKREFQVDSAGHVIDRLVSDAVTKRKR